MIVALIWGQSGGFPAAYKNPFHIYKEDKEIYCGKGEGGKREEGAHDTERKRHRSWERDPKHKTECEGKRSRREQGIAGGVPFV